MEKKSKAILQALKQLNGTSIAAIDTFTPVKLTGGRKNAMQGKIFKKVCGSNIMFFCNLNSNGYENMVNKRLEKEGKEPFTLSPRAWGERVTGTPFVAHKGNIYIEAIFLKAPKSIEYFYKSDENIYMRIEKDAIDGLPEKQEGDQGGLDNKVIIRTYHLENITSLKMGELSVI